jgi:hypothetical protein
MYEIIADPKDYGIEALVKGLGENKISFDPDERKRWALEIGIFSEKLDGLSAKAKELKSILVSAEEITATPAALKTLKVQLFNINDALTASIEIAGKLEKEFIKK